MQLVKFYNSFLQVYEKKKNKKKRSLGSFY